MMKRQAFRTHYVGVSLVAVIGFALMTLATPAAAYVVEAVTSIPIADATDEARLESAVRSAVGDVMSNAIAFSPTVAMLIDSKVIGDRIYLFVLLSDADGEDTIEALSAGDARNRREGA